MKPNGVAIWRLTGYLPVTVAGVTLVSWWFAANGYYVDMDTVGTSVLDVVNPFYYFESLVLHGDWQHFISNVKLFVPIGAVLTLLTGNRHVLSVVAVSEVLTGFVGFAMRRAGYGMSTAVFAVLGATMVRSTSVAFQDRSSEALQAALLGVMAPLVGAALLVGVVDVGSDVAHFLHLLGFVFGSAIESIYVLSDRERETGDGGTGTAVQL